MSPPRDRGGAVAGARRTLPLPSRPPVPVWFSWVESLGLVLFLRAPLPLSGWREVPTAGTGGLGRFEWENLLVICFPPRKGPVFEAESADEGRTEDEEEQEEVRSEEEEEECRGR